MMKLNSMALLQLGPHSPLNCRKNYGVKSIATSTMTIFVFLILIVHIHASSLLKLPALSSEERHRHYRRLEEESKVNKVALLLQNDPDATRKATTSTTKSSPIPSTHYSQKKLVLEDKEKSGKGTNSANAVDSLVVIQDDPNEEGRKKNSKSDNNDKDDDGRQVTAPKRTKTATKPSTFDLATSSSSSSPTTTSTLFSQNNQDRVRRHTRSLKNNTHTAKKKVIGVGSAAATAAGGFGSEKKNHYDKYPGLVHGDEKKNDIKTRSFEAVSAREEAEAIERFQKAFVNGNDISVSDAVAYSGMDMGIVEEKFERKHGPKSFASGKGEDKNSIEQDKQLFPSELGDGNNDIKMQDFEDLISSTATTTTASTATTFPASAYIATVAAAAANTYLKDNTRLKENAATTLAAVSSGNGKKASSNNNALQVDTTATEEKENEESRETLIIRHEAEEANDDDDDDGAEVDDDDDDRNSREVVAKEVEKFDKSGEGAPEGIDSIENASSFYSYYSSRNNNDKKNNNNLHEAAFNQSSRLTFASSADFDNNAGSSIKSGGRGGGGGGSGPDFLESQSAASAASTASADEVKLYRLVQRLLKESPLIDGHNDLPWNLRKFLHGQLLEFNFNSDLRSTPPWSKSAWSHTDLPRLRRGLVGAQFWVAYAPCESQNLNAVQITLEQIDLIRRLIARYPDHLTLALSADDIEKAHKDGKIASLIAVEGGHCIGSSISTLRSFYELGVRYMTLTHNCNTPWADSARPGHKPEHGGLTEFGRAVVREMNRLGMLVDLSHSSKFTMKDALKVSKAPVIFSHSSAFALCNSSRNVPDDILKELVWNRGIIMVTFYNIYVKCQLEASVRDVADHINYIRGKISIEHIGIGSDFDGINLTPVGLEDASKFPNLFVELARSPNWSNDELKMVAGRNFLRVFREAENVRDVMRSAGTPASFELIPPTDPIEATRCRLNISALSSSSIH